MLSNRTVGSKFKLFNTLFHLPLIIMVGDWEGPHKWNSLGPLFFSKSSIGFMLLNLQFSMYCVVDHCLSFCTFSLTMVLSVFSFFDSQFLITLLVPSNRIAVQLKTGNLFLRKCVQSCVKSQKACTRRVKKTACVNRQKSVYYMRKACELATMFQLFLTI